MKTATNGACATCGSMHHATGSHEAILIRSRSSSLRAWDRKRQNDNAVAYSIESVDPKLLPLWDRLKRTIKGSIDERTEAFLQYAHDHESEVMQAVIEESEAKLAASIAARYARDAVSFSTEVPF